MKFRIVVILAALLLLVVVVGWFLAGNDSTPSAPIPTESVTISAPAVAPPPPVPPIASAAPSAPANQPPATVAVPVPPPAVPSSGPVVQPFQIPGQQARPPVPPAKAGSGGAAQNPPADSSPPAAPSPEVSAAVALDLDKVNLMLRDFRTRMGTNPVGNNAEIMKAVMGDNPKGARLGPPEGQSLNGNGELVDRWGTAYFFHQMSGTSMEIHSAGPDRTFGTPDDMIQR